MFAHEDGGPEPDWVRIERDQFSDFRDLNKDGKMDLEEIRHWILPQDYDHAQAEARHLVYESDTDKVRTYWDTVQKYLQNFSIDAIETNKCILKIDQEKNTLSMKLFKCINLFDTHYLWKVFVQYNLFYLFF